MVKTDTILILGLAAGGVYLLSRSGVLGGVSSAVGGVGEGIGVAGQAAGYNLADIFNAFGQLGQSSQLIIKEGGLQTREIIREGGELVTDVTHELGEDVPKVVDYLGDIPRDIADTASTWSGSLRDVAKSGASAFRYTWSLDEPTNIFSGIGRAAGGVFDWVKRRVSPSKSLKNDISTSAITGAVISSPTTTTPTIIQTGGGGGGGGGSIRTSTRNQFLETIGYEGTSSAGGITYTKPEPSFLGIPQSQLKYPTPTPTKKWWQFW